jgi:hypothetical protein
MEYTFEPININNKDRSVGNNDNTLYINPRTNTNPGYSNEIICSFIYKNIYNTWDYNYNNNSTYKYPEENESEEDEPIDVKPIDVKPIDVKPIDVKPIDVKPMEVKPIEVNIGYKYPIKKFEYYKKPSKKSSKKASKSKNYGYNKKPSKKASKKASKSSKTSEKFVKYY